MFYSFIFILYPIWILLQQKNTHNHLKSIATDLESESESKSLSESYSDKLVFINNRTNNYAGFDLHQNNSNLNLTFNSNSQTFIWDNNKELHKIATYFRKLKQLQFLNSPLISEECKIECAKEVLEEAKEKEKEHKIKKNDFWETYDDMFF
jgi:hypothetical protein